MADNEITREEWTDDSYDHEADEALWESSYECSSKSQSTESGISQSRERQLLRMAAAVVNQDGTISESALSNALTQIVQRPRDLAASGGNQSLRQELEAFGCALEKVLPPEYQSSSVMFGQTDRESSSASLEGFIEVQVGNWGYAYRVERGQTIPLNKLETDRKPIDGHKFAEAEAFRIRNFFAGDRRDPCGPEVTKEVFSAIKQILDYSGNKERDLLLFERELNGAMRDRGMTLTLDYQDGGVRASMRTAAEEITYGLRHHITSGPLLTSTSRATSRPFARDYSALTVRSTNIRQR